MPAPNVIYIPSSRETRKQRAAVYARISTSNIEQEESLSEQTYYYTEKIKSDPNLEFAGIYADM
jgi:site-specific DNA recombinase